jgi:type III restriction enzyme
MAKSKKKTQEIDFSFYTYLRIFHEENRKKIYAAYQPITRKFLHFNSPDNPTAFLRRPQFEALEMYVFLKEFCGNRYLYEIFEEWYHRAGSFEGRSTAGISAKGQATLFTPFELEHEEDKDLFHLVFEQIKSFRQSYPNYIFALTMGLGKTVLMATSIFYEFILANKYPKDPKYCHNVLVFAPDKTVLQSLREIQTFDLSRVAPPEYVNWLQANLKFFFLDDTGDALNAIEHSMFNIIISNTQKIILKKQHKERTPSLALFQDYGKVYKAKSLNKDYEDLYGFDINTDTDLITNQRFAKLTRLKQLGIYVDEAHHVFGNALADDLMSTTRATSLRVTINELAANLEEAGTHVVGCYNYTGTPYVGARLLPEVVYAYGLRDAIDNRFLKRARVEGFEHIKDQTLPFVRYAVQAFWKAHEGKRYEGMLPKMAFFASTIEELQTELRPAVERVLGELGIPHTKILVNVGDEKITTNDDLREFKNLDTPGSEKQFILLVNKGKEGWNCRSLFGVALHREPKSKVFVLQATMRCLRQIGEVQETGLVFLSDENVRILDAELQSNFRLTVDELNSAGDQTETIEVRLVPPPVKVKLRKVRKLFQMKEKDLPGSINLKLEEADTEKYRIIKTERSLSDLSRKIGPEEDVTHIKEKRAFSELTLVAEIARYLNRSPLWVSKILDATVQGKPNILEAVNDFNELLYDWIIPRLFKELFDFIEYKTDEEVEVELVRPPKASRYQAGGALAMTVDPGYGFDYRPTTATALAAEEDVVYRLKAKSDLIVRLSDEAMQPYRGKSFHLDAYCFDSGPELALFHTLLRDKKVEKVWFTGMLTHGQTDFFIPYIDPESHTVRSYYPDFLVQLSDGSYVIVEVKGDNKIDDAVVKAKAEYATQLAAASKMSYQMVKGSEAMEGRGI